MPNFNGPTCKNSIVNGCASNPCSANEICVNNQDNSYSCLCIPGSPECISRFSSLVSPYIPAMGTKNSPLSPCSNSPCKNDGVCLAVDSQLYKCTCKFGYVGKNCEQVDECLLKVNICKNGGICQMIDKKAVCSCPPGYEQPYCDEPNYSSIFCQINVCKNGGTCVHSGMNAKNNGMKCICKLGYTGVFCETSVQMERSMQSNVPNICKTTNMSIINNEPIRLTKTAYSADSFYIIQGNKIWFVNKNQYIDFEKWPQKLSNIFPTIEEPISGIFYDSSRNEYSIFKGNRYWKFSANYLDPLQSTEMLAGYPRFIKDNFGVRTVDGSFFVESENSDDNEKRSNNNGNMNYIMLFKNSKFIKYDMHMKPIGVYHLPFDVDLFQTAISFDSNSFFLITYNKILKFSLRVFHNSKLSIISLESNIMKSFL